MISDSKIEYLDKAFLGTMESSGYKNAKLGIRMALFNDDSISSEDDKWLYISNKYEGRSLAKKLHQIDLMQILVKFCFQYMGVENRKFTIDKEKYLEIKDNLFPSMFLNEDELIEFVVYSALNGVEEVYILLSTHKDLVLEVANVLFRERYLNKRMEELDNFKEINYPRMKIKEYEYFKEKYKYLDMEFGLLKRKNPEYE